MKKVFKILTLIMLILTIVKITDTYAKYYTKATAVTEQEVGKWEILLNNTDIYSETGQEVEFTITASNLTTSANTAAGKIAPGSEWQADIVINPAGTDVAVRYDIEVDMSSIVGMDIEYEITVDEGTIIRTGEDTYSGFVTLADILANKQIPITCAVKWNNTESTNDEDTALASTYGVEIVIPVKVTCTQYLGETITPYT